MISCQVSLPCALCGPDACPKPDALLIQQVVCRDFPVIGLGPYRQHGLVLMLAGVNMSPMFHRTCHTPAALDMKLGQASGIGLRGNGSVIDELDVSHLRYSAALFLHL
jgi:hypothetical protein